MNKLSTLLSRLIWLSLLPLLLLVCVLAAYHVRSEQASTREAAIRRIDNYAAHIDGFLEARIHALGILAESPLADDPQRWPELYAQAQTFRARFGSHVIFADAERQMLFDTRVPFGAALPRLPEVFSALAAGPVALETGRPAVGDIVQGPVINEPLVAIVVPGLRGGRVRHLLLVTATKRELEKRLDEIWLTPGWALSVQDSAGDLIARQAPAGFDPARDVDAAWRFAAKSRLSPWTITAEVPRTVLREPLFDSMAVLLLAIVLATLAGRILGRRGADRIERQITALGDDGPGVPRADIVEIAAVRAHLDFHQAALRDSEERHRSLFDNSHLVMLLIDPDAGTIVAANPAAAAFYGWEREQLEHMRIDQINVLTAAEVAAEMQLAQAQHRSSFEFRHRLAGGQVRDVAVFSSTVQVGGRPLLYSIVQDITARKQVEAVLREATVRHAAHQADALEAQRQSRVAALNMLEDAVTAKSRADALASTLSEQLDELHRWRKAALNHESRILTVKREVNELLAKRGQPPRYPSAVDTGTETEA